MSTYDPNQTNGQPDPYAASYPGDPGQQPYPGQAPQYPNGGQVPGYVQQPMGYAPGVGPYDNSTSKNALGGWALGLGIAALCCSIFTGVPAIICGILGINAANRGEATNKNMSIIGISLAIFFILLNIVVTLMNPDIYNFSN